MNERIKQLAKQAQKVVGHTDGGYTELKELDQEKFAELIVKECLQEIEYLLVDDEELFADEETRDHVNESLLSARTNISYAFGIPDDELTELYFPVPSESKE
jgi:hypothetical protein